jgi:hypothetical protein
MQLAAPRRAGLGARVAGAGAGDEERHIVACRPAGATISCTIWARSGVRWSAPAAPRTLQAGGAQSTRASVSGRDEALKAALVKAAASSASSPRICSLDALVVTVSTVNWI